MRWATFTYFLNAIQGSFTVSTVVYYFVYVSMVPLEGVGLGVAGVAFVSLVVEAICTAIWSCVLGKGKGADRAKSIKIHRLRWYMLIFHLISVVMAIVGGLFVAPVIERDQIGTPVSLLLFMTMYRVPGSVFVVWLSAVSGWAIDEDYHKSLEKNGQAKRREASWAGLRLFARGMGQTIGFLIIGSVMGLGSLFPAICNSEIAAKDQDMACPRAIHFLWTWLNPIFLFLIGVSGFMYPIHGKRLIDLINMQGTTQILRPGTKAARVAAGGEGGASGVVAASTTEVTVVQQQATVQIVTPSSVEEASAAAAAAAAEEEAPAAV